jgi:hypothetical protein
VSGIVPPALNPRAVTAVESAFKPEEKQSCASDDFGCGRHFSAFLLSEKLHHFKVGKSAKKFTWQGLDTRLPVFDQGSSFEGKELF